MKTPTTMLLRGQNLVGYRNYADDVAALCAYAAEAGMDIFRVFDALNDKRNVEASLKADGRKKAGKAHFQAAWRYTMTKRLGGPIFNLEYYVDIAKRSRGDGCRFLLSKGHGRNALPV